MTHCARCLIAIACAILGMSGASSQTRPEVTAPVTHGAQHFMYVGNSFFYYNRPAFVRNPARRRFTRG